MNLRSDQRCVSDLFSSTPTNNLFSPVDSDQSVLRSARTNPFIQLTVNERTCTIGVSHVDSADTTLSRRKLERTVLPRLHDTAGCHRHPSKFQRVSRLGFVTTPTSLNEGHPNFARCLAVSWAGTLYIHFGGLLLLNEFFQVQYSHCVQVLRSPILAALLYGTRAVGVSQTAAWQPRNTILVRYMLWLCVCLSVRLSVTSLSSIKRPNRLPRKQRCTTTTAQAL